MTVAAFPPIIFASHRKTVVPSGGHRTAVFKLMFLLLATGFVFAWLTLREMAHAEVIASLVPITAAGCNLSRL